QVERLLADGIARQRAGASAEARRRFTEAVRMAPTAYMPELLRAGVEVDTVEAIRALTRAEALNPRSCAAPYRLGERLAETGDRDGAAAAFHRARVVAPTFGAPQQRLGEPPQEAGRGKEGRHLDAGGALQNGAFALPIARLANVAMREGRVEKAVGLLERSLDHDPGLWLTNLLVGRAYIELKRFHQARVHLQRALDGAEDRGLVLTEIAK